MTRRVWGVLGLVLVVVGLSVAVAGGPGRAAQAQTPYPIDTIVVVYMENRSFDHLFGGFPGANGRSALSPVPGGTPTPLPQVQLSGQPYSTLPQPNYFDETTQQCLKDPRLPTSLYPRNAPWQIP